MTFKGYDFFVNSIDDPRSLWEEIFLQFISRDDPVPRSDHHRRSIKFIKCKFGNVLRQVFQERASFVGIAYQNNPAGFFQRLNNYFVVKRNE